MTGDMIDLQWNQEVIMDQKIKFEIPEAEIIRFDMVDIIRTSGRKIIFCTSNGVDCMENAMMD